MRAIGRAGSRKPRSEFAIGDVDSRLRRRQDGRRIGPLTPA